MYLEKPVSPFANYPESYIIKPVTNLSADIVAFQNGLAVVRDTRKERGEKESRCRRTRERKSEIFFVRVAYFVSLLPMSPVTTNILKMV